ncbi:hypothetical protein AB9T88_12390 [Flavobacterium sp. LBUM151]
MKKITKGILFFALCLFIFSCSEDSSESKTVLKKSQEQEIEQLKKRELQAPRVKRGVTAIEDDTEI